MPASVDSFFSASGIATVGLEVEACGCLTSNLEVTAFVCGISEDTAVEQKYGPRTGKGDEILFMDDDSAQLRRPMNSMNPSAHDSMNFSKSTSKPTDVNHIWSR